MSTGSTFGQLLRKSRLASFDTTLPQVYTTKGGFKHRRDWGLMRNLPELKTDYITVQALDTPEHQTPFQSANDKVQFVKRWHEMGVPSTVGSGDVLYDLMGSSRMGKGKGKSKGDVSTAPNPFQSESAFEPVSHAKNIAEMKPLHFQRFKRSLMRKEKRDEWFNAVIEGKVRLEDDRGLKEDLSIFLKISTEQYRPGAANAGLSYLPDPDMKESSTPLATVRGRILSTGGGNTFALGGLIVKNTKVGGSGAAVMKAFNSQGEDGVLFNISQAYLDYEGRPHLILQVMDTIIPQYTSSRSRLNAKSIFEDLRTTTPKANESRPQSQPQPQQATIRIADLLEKLFAASKKPDGQKRQMPKIHQDILDITKGSLARQEAKLKEREESESVLEPEPEPKPKPGREK